VPKSLVIVESPAKAKTLKQYLGKDFSVMATVGHIKNLPKSKLGVDLENGYQPDWITIKGKGETLKKIKAAARKADFIYLAPDPDREGEAIASHIADEIGTEAVVYRVLFNEITKSAVLKAISNRGKIDASRVKAQTARRVLDRLMGYNLSPLLWEKIRRGLSAGRVQSVALRLVVERERKIQAFEPVEYWSIIANVMGKSKPQIEARLMHYKGEKTEVGSAKQADKIAKTIESAKLKITKLERKERKRNPSAPFITSTMQQEASRKLRYSARRTMGVAQRLYEGLDVNGEGPVGLITYMRTDSTRASDEAITQLREFVQKEIGIKYIPATPNTYKTKKSAQDAHEAIRPTSVERTPETLKNKLSKEEFALYELIWKRFVSSQMTPAIMDVTTVDIKAGLYNLRATGSIMKFDGFLRVYEESADNSTNNKEGEARSTQTDKEKYLPANIQEGDILELLGVEKKQHFTQPPPRFTEAMLIKEMEENGIGRPSTYAHIMETIQSREYCKLQERRLHPSELGILVAELLVENFPRIVNVEFTAKMEAELDEVEEGHKQWTVALDDFYKPFSADLEKAKTHMRNVKEELEKTDIKCEKCGNLMVIKFGRYGKFLACSGYPECRNTSQIQENGEAAKVDIPDDEPTDEICPKCGKNMVVKTGRFGKFIACSNYPECKTTKQVGTGILCPKDNCGGELVQRRTRFGKFFYGCNRYPDCDFTVWGEPVNEKCPECNNPILIKKSLKAGNFVACPVKECDYKKEIEDSV
jgi:DNA topoisomerase-1